MQFGKEFKRCGNCGDGVQFYITVDNRVLCADCGKMVGYYSDNQVPPSGIVNKPELQAAYMDAFDGRNPTEEELRLIEEQLENDFLPIAREIASAVEELRKKGKLPLWTQEN